MKIERINYELSESEAKVFAEKCMWEQGICIIAFTQLGDDSKGTVDCTRVYFFENTDPKECNQSNWDSLLNLITRYLKDKMRREKKDREIK